MEELECSVCHKKFNPKNPDDRLAYVTDNETFCSLECWHVIVDKRAKQIRKNLWNYTKFK